MGVGVARDELMVAWGQTPTNTHWASDTRDRWTSPADRCVATSSWNRTAAGTGGRLSVGSREPLTSCRRCRQNPPARLAQDAAPVGPGGDREPTAQWVVPLRAFAAQPALSALQRCNVNLIRGPVTGGAGRVQKAAGRAS